MVADQRQELEEEFFQLDEENKSDIEKSSLSGKMVDVLGPDGQVYEIDESEVEFLPEGYRLQ